MKEKGLRNNDVRRSFGALIQRESQKRKEEVQMMKRRKEVQMAMQFWRADGNA